MLLAKVSIAALMLTVAGIFIHEYIPLISTLLGAAFAGYLFHKANQKQQHLGKKYNLIIQPKKPEGN